MKILWAFTGAGHLLKESIDVLDKLSYTHQITIATSHAAEEVIRLYGYDDLLNEIISRNENNSFVRQKDQEHSYPFSGKLTHNKFDIIIVSPTTANTTAKIVHGIADTLVTNIVAQSGKGQIPTIIMPVDQKEGIITTIIPPYIEKNLCTLCNACVNVCMFNALHPPEIDTVKCSSCKKCVKACKYNAIIIGKEIELYIRKIDAENTKKLGEIENIKTTMHPYNIPAYINRLTKRI